MSTWYEVMITALQPVSVGRSGARGFLTPTYPYLPGSVVRGALARAWITRHGQPGQRFIEVFERQVRYGPALPPGFRQDAQTVVRCKYHRDGSGHEEVYDLAYGRGQVCDPEYGTRPPDPCQSWEQSRGQLTWAGAETVTSTALEPGTITVATQQLFSRGTLPKGTVFTGYLVAEQEVPELAEIDRIVVGGRGSVMGESSVTITRGEPPASDTHLLVTRTPAILVDTYGRPTLDPGFALELAGITSGCRWKEWAGQAVRPRDQIEGMGGWHIASGLPKPGEIAVAPGLVIGLERREDVQTLLEHGLGLRRQEGFGWLAPYTPKAPYTPPRDQDQEPAETNQWKKQVAELAESLVPEQASWLADQFREVPPGNTKQAQEVLDQPAADYLSGDQREQVTRLLTGMPRDLRAALAHYLDSRYGKGSQA